MKIYKESLFWEKKHINSHILVYSNDNSNEWIAEHKIEQNFASVTYTYLFTMRLLLGFFLPKPTTYQSTHLHYYGLIYSFKRNSIFHFLKHYLQNVCASKSHWYNEMNTWNSPWIDNSIDSPTVVRKMFWNLRIWCSFLSWLFINYVNIYTMALTAHNNRPT